MTRFGMVLIQNGQLSSVLFNQFIEMNEGFIGRTNPRYIGHAEANRRRRKEAATLESRSLTSSEKRNAAVCSLKRAPRNTKAKQQYTYCQGLGVADFLLFIRVIWREWKVLLTGGSICAFLAIWSLSTGNVIPRNVAWAVLATTFASASFQAWRKEHSQNIILPPPTIINVSPLDLVAAFTENTDFQARKIIEPYLGKWVRWPLEVGNVSLSNTGFVLHAYFGGIHIFLKSFAATSTEYLPILSRGSQIVVTGKIHDIDSGTVRLDECDLKPQSEPSALPKQELTPQADQSTGTAAVPEIAKKSEDVMGLQPSVQPPAPLRRRPHLSCGEFSSFGMYQLIPDLIGAGFRIINDEKRFLSTAHNLQASIKLAHALGEELMVRQGIWYEHSSKRIEILGNIVSLGMQEQCWLMLFVTNNAVLDCRVVNYWPPDMTGAPQLEYGEWRVQVAITGDNINHDFSGTLTIQKEGGFGWTPQA